MSGIEQVDVAHPGDGTQIEQFIPSPGPPLTQFTVDPIALDTLDCEVQVVPEAPVTGVEDTLAWERTQPGSPDVPRGN